MWASSGRGQGFGFGEFAISDVVVLFELGCETGVGSPSSGGSGEMAGAFLSSSMGVGLALMEGGGRAKE